MKNSIILLFVAVLFYACGSDTAPTTEIETTDQPQVDYSKEVEHMDTQIKKIENEKTVLENYIYYDEYGESNEVSIYRNKDGSYNKFEILLSFEPTIYVSFYLDGDHVIMLDRTEIIPSFWQEEKHHLYYINNTTPFYTKYQFHKKGEITVDTAYSFTKFTEEDALPLYLTRQSIESVIQSSIIKDNHVSMDDFKLTDNFLTIKGTPTPSYVDRQEQMEMMSFDNDIKIKIHSPFLNETSQASTVSLNYKNDNEYDIPYKTLVTVIGAVDNYVFLSVDELWGNYELQILNAATGKIEFKERIRGQVYQNDELLMLKPVTKKELENVTFSGDCSVYEQENSSYERCGVFALKLGKFKPIFTNQVFCLYVQ